MQIDGASERAWAQERFSHADPLTHSIIGAAIAVHRQLGPGLLETVYHQCLKLELRALKVPFESEIRVPISYRETTLDAGLRLDLLVGEQIIVEIKAVETILPVHLAQLLTYMKLASKPVGLLINFNTPLLKDGIHRRVL